MHILLCEENENQNTVKILTNTDNKTFWKAVQPFLLDKIVPKK